MQSLPPITIDDEASWLPLSCGAAQLLFQAVAGQPAVQSDWTKAIRFDPPLALWLFAQLNAVESVASAGEETLPFAADHEWSTLAEFSQAAANWVAGSGCGVTSVEGLDWQKSVSVDCDAKLLLAHVDVGGVALGGNDSVFSLLIEGVGWLHDQQGLVVSDARMKATRDWLKTTWCQRGRGVPNGEDVICDDNKKGRAEERGASELAAYWSIDAKANAFAGLLPAICGRLAKTRELQCDFESTVEQAKLAAMKELAYGASHELNNPLANISSRAQTLIVNEEDPDRRKALAAINRQAFRGHEMIADMMLFANPPRMETTEFCLVALAGEVVAGFAAEAKSQNTELRLVPAVSADGGGNTESAATVHAMQVNADREQLAVAISALIRNSLEALHSGGEVELQITRTASESGKSAACLTVSDNGPGINPEVRKHLFDPFYSGREAGRGLGFGLSRVWRIAEQHGGSVEVASGPISDSQGDKTRTTVEIRIPV